MCKTCDEDTALAIVKAFRSEYLRWYFRGFEGSVFEAVLDPDGAEKAMPLSGSRDEAQEQFERMRDIACGHAVMAGNFTHPKQSESGWLLEMPPKEGYNLPRWYHPKLGWVQDASKALRFTRKVDVEDFYDGSNLTIGCFASEHAWG